MTKNIALSIVLTFLATACTITPTETETEPTDQTTNPTCNPTEPEPTYQTCPEVYICDGAPSCDAEYHGTCSGVAFGNFECGNRSGFYFSDGTLFLCGESGCSSALSSASKYCADLAEANLASE